MHLENKNSLIRMLFGDFSSAFDTIIAMKLTGKLNTLGLSTTLCDSILDYLRCRPRTVRIGIQSSAPSSSLSTPMTALPDIIRITLWSMTKTLTSPCCIMNSNEGSYWEELLVSETCNSLMIHQIYFVTRCSGPSYNLGTTDLPSYLFFFFTK